MSGSPPIPPSRTGAPARAPSRRWRSSRGLGTVMRTPDGAERLIGAFVTDEYFRVMPEPAAARPRARAIRLRARRARRGGDLLAAVAAAVRRRPVRTGPEHHARRPELYGRRRHAGGLRLSRRGPTCWAPITAILATDPALQQRALHVDSRVVGRLRAGVDSAAGAAGALRRAAHLAETYPAESGGWRSGRSRPWPPRCWATAGRSSGCSPRRRCSCCSSPASTSPPSRWPAPAPARASSPSAPRWAAAAARCSGCSPPSAWCWASRRGRSGSAAAVGLVRWLRVAGRDLLPRADEVAVDPRALAAAVVLAIALVVRLGLLPALRRLGPADAARSRRVQARGPGRRAGGFGPRWWWARSRSRWYCSPARGCWSGASSGSQRVRTGFDDDRLVAVPIEPPSPRYDSPERALQLYRDVAAAVARVPGRPGGGAHQPRPAERRVHQQRHRGGGRARGRGDASDEVLFREVDSAYFRTAGIPIVRGRDFTAEEIAHPGDAVLVNQALAARYWPGGDPIGQADHGVQVGAGAAGVRAAGPGDHRRGRRQRAPLLARHRLRARGVPAVHGHRVAADGADRAHGGRARAADPDARARGPRGGPRHPARGRAAWSRVYDLRSLAARVARRTAASSPACWRRSRCRRCCWPRSGSTA